MVVADPGLVAGDRAGGLDPPDQAGLGEGAQDVVDRLVRDLRSACRASRMTASVSACGWACTASSTASRGRVTRRDAPRRRSWSSRSSVMVRVWNLFWSQSRLTRRASQSWARSMSAPSSVRLSSRISPDRQPAELDGPDGGAGQPGHRVADVLEQAPHDAVATLVDDQLDDGALARRTAVAALDDAGAGHRHGTVVERDAGEELLDDPLVELALDLGDVGLLDLVRRVRQALGEVAVVGEDQQARRVGVEPADVEEPLGPVGDQVAERSAGPRGRTSSRPRRAAC